MCRRRYDGEKIPYTWKSDQCADRALCSRRLGIQFRRHRHLIIIFVQMYT